MLTYAGVPRSSEYDSVLEQDPLGDIHETGIYLCVNAHTHTHQPHTYILDVCTCLFERICTDVSCVYCVCVCACICVFACVIDF
jgi:hypothetical protein